MRTKAGVPEKPITKRELKRRRRLFAQHYSRAQGSETAVLVEQASILAEACGVTPLFMLLILRARTNNNLAPARVRLLEKMIGKGVRFWEEKPWILAHPKHFPRPGDKQKAPAKSSSKSGIAEPKKENARTSSADKILEPIVVDASRCRKQAKSRKKQKLKVDDLAAMTLAERGGVAVVTVQINQPYAQIVCLADNRGIEIVYEQ